MLGCQTNLKKLLTMRTKILSLLVLISVSISASFAQTARVQVIHNSADTSASVVDVYVNGTLAIPDFEFRTATPFLSLPAGVSLSIAVAPGNSNSVADALATFNYTLTANQTYVIVANGIVSQTGYSPATAFDLHVYDMGREEAATGGNTDVLVFHGSTDAPAVSVYETGVGAGMLFNDFMYGDFEGYLPLANDDYVLEVRDNSGTVTVASYDAPLQTLGLEDSALVVLASGFLAPSMNSNGPAFGLWAALPSGGDLVELPTSTAQIQVIHNSADLAASEVDVYVGGDLVLDDFAFRTTTPFLEAPAGVELEVAIAPSNSDTVADAIATFNYTLASGEKYVLIANGIVSQSGYSPATAFDIYVYAMGQTEAGTSGNTDVLVFHGATDAPTVSVYETGVGAGMLFNDFMYSDFEGYLPLATNDYTLEIRDNSGTTTVASYDAPLATLNLQDSALVVLASGFLNPANNSNGPAFGLWAALASGGNLVELPVASTTSISENNTGNEINLFPNPVNDIMSLNLNMENAGEDVIVEIFDTRGARVKSWNFQNISTTNNTLTLNTEDLSEGMYHLNVLSGATLETRSFVVVR